MADWSSYLEGRDDVERLRKAGCRRDWKGISRWTGLSWEEARDLGCHLRGVPHRFAGKLADPPPDAEISRKSANRKSDFQSSPEPASVNDGVKLTVEHDTAEAIAKGTTICTLPQLLEAAEIDLDLWLVESWKANTWQANAGSGEVINLWQVKANLRRRPEWDLNPIRPVRHLKRRRTRSTSPRECALIIPDSQNGYRWNTRHDTLDPLHDRRAWDVAVQMAQRLQPDVIVMLGDMLDLASWSKKFPRPSSFASTTQPTLAELHWWIGQLRMAAPGARILYLEGNHEDRVSKAILSDSAEAEGVRPVDDEDGPAMMSIPRLLALDSLDVEYIAPYDSEHWLWDSVRVHHGETVRAKGGATVSAVVQSADHHDIIGHIHRLELACRTSHGPDGERVIWALSPGTITRIDGVVPAGTSRVDWQQGLAVIERTEQGQIFPQLLAIEDGRTVWCREVIEGRDRVGEIRDATGWRF